MLGHVLGSNQSAEVDGERRYTRNAQWRTDKGCEKELLRKHYISPAYRVNDSSCNIL